MILQDNTKLLVRRLQNNDLDAFNELYYQYHQPVYRNICKLIYQYEIAEDILQEVFMNLWTHRSKLDPDKSVAGWLFVVSFNKSMNWIRTDIKETREKNIAAVLTDSTEYNKSDEQQYSGQLKMLNGAVEKLPYRKKQAFKLCKLEGRSYEEAGSILGISPETVKEYVKMSKQLIRQHIVADNSPAIITGTVSMLQFLCA